MIFALHPLQVESVAWTTGLKDVLCGLFACAAIGLYAEHARRDPPIPWHDGYWWAALAGAVLAMLSKPTGMVLPLMLAAVDWAVRSVPIKRAVRRAGAVSSAGRRVRLHHLGGARTLASGRRAAAAAATGGGGHLRGSTCAKVVWPMPLSVDYGRRPAVVIASGAVWWAWVLPAAVLAGVAWVRSRKLWLAAVLFVVPVLPVSGLATFDMQQYSTVTDHYVYQPLLGVGLAVTLGLAALRPGWMRSAAGGVVLLVVAAAGVTSHRACNDWTSNERLYALMLAHNPDSWLARNVLARLSVTRGDLFTGSRLAGRTLQQDPRNGLALDVMTYRDLLLGDYASAATTGQLAVRQVGLPRADAGKRLALLGAKLGDRDLAETGVRHWLLAEPSNPYAREMFGAILASKRQSAATRQARTP